MRTQAATNPHTIAAHGSTTEHPDVMAANPPRRPLQTSVTVQWPTRSRLLNRVVSAAVQPAMLYAFRMVRNEPGLNPYHPNHNRKDPRTTRDALCPRRTTERPARSNRPIRGPSIKAPQRPAIPPTIWTTPEPAKSMAPEPKRRGPLVRAGLAQPSADQNQWETIG
ncbi:hypothetical protein CRG98_038267 [Punica granatum]|uniref:Uncharacterized protein n=1 Tax=Punica granatum TaxID=22663 RepID=A0A2I0IBL1_PUNGR|nr:hypothetical protein CRG98_038267 [Punica granatum]